MKRKRTISRHRSSPPLLPPPCNSFGKTLPDKRRRHADAGPHRNVGLVDVANEHFQVCPVEPSKSEPAVITSAV
jgi:hypothetical protein